WRRSKSLQLTGKHSSRGNNSSWPKTDGSRWQQTFPMETVLAIIGASSEYGANFRQEFAHEFRSLTLCRASTRLTPKADSSNRPSCKGRNYHLDVGPLSASVSGALAALSPPRPHGWNIAASPTCSKVQHTQL